MSTPIINSRFCCICYLTEKVKSEMCNSTKLRLVSCNYCFAIVQRRQITSHIKVCEVFKGFHQGKICDLSFFYDFLIQPLFVVKERKNRNLFAYRTQNTSISVDIDTDDLYNELDLSKYEGSYSLCPSPCPSPCPNPRLRYFEL